MKNSRGTIFSNGIVDFRRSYEVKCGGATKISIPVTKDHVGDVLASLNVFGHVGPPSDTSSNATTLN